MVAPLAVGAIHDTARLALSTVSVGALGASGFCGTGVAVAEVDHAPVPPLLVARTCTWYAVLSVRLVMVAFVAVPVWGWLVQSSAQVLVVPSQARSLLSPSVAVQARYCTS